MTSLPSPTSARSMERLSTRAHERIIPTNDQQVCGVPRDEPLVTVGPDKSDTVRGLGGPLEK